MTPEDIVGHKVLNLLDSFGYCVTKKNDLAQLQAQSASIGHVDPGVVSPKHTWPDDTEVNQWIDEAQSLNEALLEIVDKYQIPVTTNLPRWQNGQFIRDAGDFIDDIRKVVEKHGL